MTLFKAKMALAAAGTVTREEFDALRREFNAFQRVTALATMAAEVCSRYTGVHGGPASTRLRLQKIAAAAETFELDAAEVDVLKGFLAIIDQERSAESIREREEEVAQAHAPTWRPDGTYNRRIT